MDPSDPKPAAAFPGFSLPPEFREKLKARDKATFAAAFPGIGLGLKKLHELKAKEHPGLGLGADAQARHAQLKADFLREQEAALGPLRNRKSVVTEALYPTLPPPASADALALAGSIDRLAVALERIASALARPDAPTGA